MGVFFKGKARGSWKGGGGYLEESRRRLPPPPDKKEGSARGCALFQECKCRRVVVRDPFVSMRRTMEG